MDLGHLKFLYNIYVYQISIVTNDFITPNIITEKDILHGDNLSQLLFNMHFSTLMLTVNRQRV